MSYAIDKQKTLDLVGGSAEYEFDVGVHPATRTVHVARATSGTVKLETWSLANDGTFSGGPGDVVVGHGTRTRIIVFDNHRIVVLWLDGSSALRIRAYNSGSASPGQPITVETLIADFDVASVGVTTGVQQPDPNTVVYYAYRQFAFTTLSQNGGWKLWFGSVGDNAEVVANQVALGGPGDKVALSCAGLNELIDNAHPRKVLTLCRDAVAGQIKTHSWRVGAMGVTSLASAAETKALGFGIVHGMSVAPNNDCFATVVWPGSSNAASRLQLVSVNAQGAMSPYASAEFAELPRSFARLQWHGTDAAVGYVTPDGHLAVAAWRFAAPGSGNAARTVVASKVGTEQPTQVRIASVMPQSDSDDDPVTLVTLSRVASGALRLVSWRMHKTLVYQPVGPNPVGVTAKP